MLKKSLIISAAVAGFMGLTAFGAPPPPPTAEAAAALKQVTGEAQKFLTQESVFKLADRARLFKDYGVTYMPEIVAPNGLEAKLTGCKLGQYVGVKMFDAVYAASFGKRQEVADCMKSIDAALQKLDIRSYADFSNHLATTLRTATTEENLDAKKLVNQLAADAANEVPAALSNPVTAHFLLDAMYGFAIEAHYTSGFFFADNLNGKIKEYSASPSSTGGAWRQPLFDLVDAITKQQNVLHLDCKTPEKLGVFKDALVLSQSRRAGKIAETDTQKVYAPIVKRTAELRAEILAVTP